MKPVENKERIPQLDGLRGLLAVYVSLHHLVMFCGVPFLGAAAVFGRGEKAVHVFIILSGFVIFQLLEKSRQGWWPFIVRRFFRLWPLLALAVLITFVTAPLEIDVWRHAEPDAVYKQERIVRCLDHSAAHLASTLLMLHGLVPQFLLTDPQSNILPPSWSIGVEWQFYLVAPMLFALTRSGRPWIWFAGLACLAVATLCGGIWKQWNHAFLPLYAGYFALGAFSLGAWNSARNNGGAAPATLAFAMAAVAWSKDTALNAWSVALLSSLPAGHALDGIVKPVKQLLASRPLVWLGDRSYSIYLLHWPVQTVCVWSLQHTSWAGQSKLSLLLVSSLLATPLVILASHLSYMWVERPFIELARRLTQRPAVPIGVETAAA